MNPNDTKDLNVFINAAKEGDLETLNACLAAQTQLQDKEGRALFNALGNVHIPCVKALITAGVPVENKHYYSAGFAGPMRARILFDILKGEQYTRAQYTNEASFDSGDLKELNKQLKSGSLSEAERSDYLLSAISQADIVAVRILLDNKTPIDVEHFFAAGRYFNTDDSSTQNTCKRMFCMLEASQDKKPLPTGFYQPEENSAYFAIVPAATPTPTPAFAPTVRRF